MCDRGVLWVESDTRHKPPDVLQWKSTDQLAQSNSVNAFIGRQSQVQVLRTQLIQRMNCSEKQIKLVNHVRAWTAWKHGGLWNWIPMKCNWNEWLHNEFALVSETTHFEWVRAHSVFWAWESHKACAPAVLAKTAYCQSVKLVRCQMTMPSI